MNRGEVPPGRDASFRQVSLHPVPGSFRVQTYDVNKPADRSPGQGEGSNSRFGTPLRSESYRWAAARRRPAQPLAYTG